MSNLLIKKLNAELRQKGFLRKGDVWSKDREDVIIKVIKEKSTWSNTLMFTAGVELKGIHEFYNNVDWYPKMLHLSNSISNLLPEGEIRKNYLELTASLGAHSEEIQNLKSAEVLGILNKAKVFELLDSLETYSDLERYFFDKRHFHEFMTSWFTESQFLEFIRGAIPKQKDKKGFK